MDGNIRKLARIERIDEIKLHPNADSLELAKIGGWQVVVKKGQFKSGDLCVYCEIDCLLPEKPEFEFLRSKHFRIKTIKLRGEISQGIIFPINILCGGSDIREFYEIQAIKVGDEVTEQLGIKKYEPSISPQLMVMAKGNFPSYLIPKTDEERLQSAMSLLDEMNDKMCYITQKEDGTSYTAFHIMEKIDDMTIEAGNILADIFGVEHVQPDKLPLFHRIGVCSRNLELKNEAFHGSDMNIYWKITKQYDIENKLKKFYQDTGRNIAIQGEITGDGIQNNKLGLPRNTYQLHLFNIYDIDNKKYLNYEEFIAVSYILDIPTVETIYSGRFNFTLEQLLEMAKGKYKGTKNNREGIVIRPVEETFSERLHGRLSFKVINNEFLLKDEE